MNKIMIGLWCVAIMGALTLLYMVRYQAQSTQEEIASIQQRVLEEKEAIHVLKAEWSYLTRPERLKQLTGQLQEMEPVTQKKVITLSDIPLNDGEEGVVTQASRSEEPAALVPQDAPSIVTLPPAAPKARVESVSLKPAVAAIVPAPQVPPPPARHAAPAAEPKAAAPKIKAVLVNHTVTEPIRAQPLPSWDVLVPEEAE